MASNATGAHVRQRIGARDRCNTIRRKCLGRLPGQYSLGKRNVVALRSASVIIQSFTPVRGSLYAERIRNPSITDRSFSRRSSSQRSPQSPETWRLRNSRPLLPSSLRASSASDVPFFAPAVGVTQNERGNHDQRTKPPRQTAISPRPDRQHSGQIGRASRRE